MITKTSESTIRRVRRMYASGNWTFQEIAGMTDVSAKRASDIVKGRKPFDNLTDISTKDDKWWWREDAK